MVMNSINRALMLAALCLHARECSSFTNGMPVTSYAQSPSSPTCCLMATTDIYIDQTPSLLMDDILKGNSTAASSVCDILMEIRGTDKMDQYLSDMLPPERSNLPWWTRMPLSRYSRRARQLRLRKLLELSTPSSSSDEQDDEESKKSRARNSLYILLRNMAKPEFKGVSSLLTTAQKDAKVGARGIPSAQLLDRTPPGLETPKYKVLSAKEGDGFEVRQYEKFSVCSVTMNELKTSLKKSGSDQESASKVSMPSLSGATSFGALAGYLFGKNEDEVAMKMTTPVLSEGEGDSRKMSFVLPSDYWQEEGKAPKPLADSSVKVSPVEGCERAVLAFSGFGRKADVDNRTRKLQEILESDNDWCAVEDAPVVLAQYNDPFTPPWKRRNEVSVLVKPRV